MNFHESVLQLRPGLFLIDRNPDGDFSSEMSISALDTKVCRDAVSGRPLALKSGDDQDAVVPRKLNIGTVHARHFDEDDDLVGAFTNIDGRRPGCALPRLLLKFEIHKLLAIFEKVLELAHKLLD